MRSITRLALFSILATSVCLHACKKYDEGPSLSLRSTETRVENTWKVEQYLKNDSDQTADFNYKHNNYNESYAEEGAYSFSYVNEKTDSKSGAGTWEFQNDEMEIKRAGISSQTTQTLHILKLKENHFWYLYMDGPDKIEMHLESN